jgi:hypothetical protein
MSSNEDDFEYIYRPYFRHPTTGKIIRSPKGKMFRIKVRKTR